jgi:hypothetical protein
MTVVQVLELRWEPAVKNDCRVTFGPMGMLCFAYYPDTYGFESGCSLQSRFGCPMLLVVQAYFAVLKKQDDLGQIA